MVSKIHIFWGIQEISGGWRIPPYKRYLRAGGFLNIRDVRELEIPSYRIYLRAEVFPQLSKCVYGSISIMYSHHGAGTV